MRRASFIALTVLSLGIVAYAVRSYAFLPLGAAVHPDMRAGFQSHRPNLIYVHVFASAVALALGPFQFWTRLRTAWPALHRWSGRIYLGVGVLFGGFAGLFVAFGAFGGFVAQLGFGFLAVAWLFTGLRAYQSIRARDVRSHRRWMVRNFALTFAAVTLRLWLPGLVVSGVPFHVAYPIIAWLSWVPNLAVAELLVNRPLRHIATSASSPASR
jgi:uncharacterized membrane protein